MTLIRTGEMVLMMNHNIGLGEDGKLFLNYPFYSLSEALVLYALIQVNHYHTDK